MPTVGRASAARLPARALAGAPSLAAVQPRVAGRQPRSRPAPPLPRPSFARLLQAHRGPRRRRGRDLAQGRVRAQAAARRRCGPPGRHRRAPRPLRHPARIRPAPRRPVRPGARHSLHASTLPFRPRRQACGAAHRLAAGRPGRSLRDEPALTNLPRGRQHHGLSPDGASRNPVVSSTGRVLAFDTTATNVARRTSTARSQDVVAIDLATNERRLISQPPGSVTGADAPVVGARRSRPTASASPSPRSPRTSAPATPTASATSSCARASTRSASSASVSGGTAGERAVVRRRHLRRRHASSSSCRQRRTSSRATPTASQTSSCQRPAHRRDHTA